jgi:RNA-directed DNA polymerase
METPDLPAPLTLAQALTLRRLRAAWEITASRAPRPGPDSETVQTYALDSEARLARLLTDLQTGRYRPRPAWRAWVAREGRAPRGVVALPVQDRIVEGALLAALRPLLEPRLHPAAYAYRQGTGTAQAVQALLALGHRLPWVVRGDVAACFDSVPHGGMAAALAPLLDQGMLDLLGQLLARPVIDRGVQSRLERGLPQGSLLAPLLANWYLRPFDHEVTGQGGELVRYADDFVIAYAQPEVAGRLAGVAAQALDTLELRINVAKTRIVSPHEGYDFLGFRLHGGDARVAPVRLAQFQAQLSGLLLTAQGEQSGHQLRAANDLIRGWQAYFRLGSVHQDYRVLDDWMAGRFPEL